MKDIKSLMLLSVNYSTNFQITSPLAELFDYFYVRIWSSKCGIQTEDFMKLGFTCNIGNSKIIYTLKPE